MPLDGLAIVLVESSGYGLGNDFQKVGCAFSGCMWIVPVPRGGLACLMRLLG